MLVRAGPQLRLVVGGGCVDWGGGSQGDALSRPERRAEAGDGGEGHLVLLGEAFSLDGVHQLLELQVALLLILAAKVVRDL